MHVLDYQLELLALSHALSLEYLCGLFQLHQSHLNWGELVRVGLLLYGHLIEAERVAFVGNGHLDLSNFLKEETHLVLQHRATLLVHVHLMCHFLAQVQHLHQQLLVFNFYRTALLLH